MNMKAAIDTKSGAFFEGNNVGCTDTGTKLSYS
jgi:hypothetical protein